MTDLVQLLRDRDNSGVHRFRATPPWGNVERAAREQGYTPFRLDCASVTTKGHFLKTAAVALRFPAHFGKNWDAFEDCLTDMEWCDAPGYVILIENAEKFSITDPSEFTIALDIFRDAAAFWRERGRGFFVLAQGPTD